MTIEEIRKGAPKGATHYTKESYYKYDYLNGWMIYMFGIGFARVSLGINTKPKPL